MAHGVPVVAFDLGGVREYLSGECGALIPAKDVDFAAKILKLYYSKPELLKESGKNGLEIVKSKFSENMFLNKFLLIYCNKPKLML